MKTIALPGRRFETESWLRSLLLAAALPDDGLLRYRHWAPNVEASVSLEAERLADMAPSLVVAKSFGTTVAAVAFDRHRFRPAATVLIGTPYEVLPAADLQQLRQLAQGSAVLCIQQVGDPGGPASRLASALQVPQGAVLAVPGDDHLYQDIASISALIRSWVETLPPGGVHAAV